jgi:ferritin-like protein
LSWHASRIVRPHERSAMSSETLHEPREVLSATSQDLHRAITSLMEELEAIDWYQQRIEATPDAELKTVLAHNRDEEIEHAMMVLEWIRRSHPKFDEAARTFLFSDGPITEVEEKMKAAAAAGEAGGGAPAKSAVPAAGGGALAIGSLRAALTAPVGVTRSAKEA